MIATGCDALFHVDAVSVVDASDAPRPIDAPPDVPIDAAGPFMGTRHVFVTSVVHGGNELGLMGADASCEFLATQAGLNNTYRAWLSSSTMNAVDRLRPGGSSIVLLNGMMVASSWTTLLQNMILAPIDLTDTMSTTPTSPACDVVTNTQPDGTRLQTDPVFTCMDWTSNNGSLNNIGASHAMATSWTDDSACGGQCSGSFRLYCFEN